MRTLVFLPLLFAHAVLASNWPSWRGPHGVGTTDEKNLPLTWSATEGVKWKVPLPGPGNSTPIVWNDRVFLTQEVGSRRTLMCFDRKDGKVLWQEGPTSTEAERTHPTNPHCSASPVTDGERVIAFFGSAGLWCWNLDGKEQWHVDLGKLDHEWGYAASPVLHGEMCYLNFGPGERAFLAAFDKTTGKERWRVDMPPAAAKLPRNDGFGDKGGVNGSWCTPLITSDGKRDILLMTWPEKICAYDPATGRELWSAGGINPLVYTSTMIGDGIVVGAGGFGGSTLAVKADTGEKLWFRPRDKQRIGSGVIKDGYLYILNTPGTAQCVDLKTGNTVWEQRLIGSGPKGESWASMILAGDRIYVTNQSGDTFILRAAPKFEQLGVNAIGDGLTNSTIVPSDGEFFLRTHQHLWCISGK